MKTRIIFILLISTLFIASCTTIQPRSVTDELYETPDEERTYAYQAENQQLDTAEDTRSSRNYRMQRSPYWMYDHYPYYPYYRHYPFDFYHNWYFDYPFYSYSPFHYGFGFSYFPYAPYYGYSWYGSYYTPFYNPYYHFDTRNYQRKLTRRPMSGSYTPAGNHSTRIRKLPPGDNNRKVIRINDITRLQPVRKNTPSKRYLRATDFLRSGSNNLSRPPIRTIQNNTRTRKSTVTPFQNPVRFKSPTRSNPVRIQRSNPVRQSNPVIRKRK